MPEVAIDETTQTLSKGERTRDRILDLAQESILQKGFAATSIDELTVAAGITKSGFLYHFKDKTELAKQLLHRYLVRDDEILDDLQARADELTDDPLQSFLIFIKLLSEMMADLPDTHPGCLAASFSYQSHMFNPEIRRMNAEGMLSWRERFHARLVQIAELYPPRKGADLYDLADHVTTIIEGGIIVSKSIEEKGILPRQVAMTRDIIKYAFQMP